MLQKGGKSFSKKPDALEKGGEVNGSRRGEKRLGFPVYSVAVVPGHLQGKKKKRGREFLKGGSGSRLPRRPLGWRRERRGGGGEGGGRVKRGGKEGKGNRAPPPQLPTIRGDCLVFRGRKGKKGRS